VGSRKSSILPLYRWFHFLPVNGSPSCCRTFHFLTYILFCNIIKVLGLARDLSINYFHMLIILLIRWFIKKIIFLIKEEDMVCQSYCYINNAY